MKNKSIMIIMLIFSTCMIGKILYTSTNPKDKISDNFPNSFDEAEVYADSLFNVEALPDTFTVTDNFDYTYTRFKVYNPNIDSSTVMTFINVCEFYGLDKSEKMLELCVGQILLESGAKQYYEANHPKSGMLVESYAGAIGFTQIMPSTAYYTLNKHVTDKEGNDMRLLGSQSFEFILNNACTKSEAINMTRGWLKNETNNIILWGYIMRSKLDKRPDMLKVLVSYNAGTTGMINYVNDGGLLTEHKYVRGIKTTLHYADNNS